MMRTLRWLVLALMAALLAACGDAAETRQPVAPAALESGDECHLCGMLIESFPGPKGQAALAGDTTPRKFCSTRDLLSWALQPEHRDRLNGIYVHDMARTEWPRPDSSAEAFVDARTAWFVAGHDQRGAMGHTLASFAEEQAARRFAGEHGGRLLRFEDISLELLAGLNGHQPTSGHAMPGAMGANAH